MYDLQLSWGSNRPQLQRQILTLTYPIVGNYGVPNTQELDGLGLKKNVESDRIQVLAMPRSRVWF